MGKNGGDVCVRDRFFGFGGFGRFEIWGGGGGVFGGGGLVKYIKNNFGKRKLIRV